MALTTTRVLLGVAMLVAPTALGGQALPDRPGARQPVAPSKPRIQPLAEAQWTDVHRQLVAKYSSDRRPDNGLKTLLNLPEIVDGVMPFTVYLSEESSLQPRHRELLILRTAWLCGNRPIWSTYAPRARAVGMSAAEIKRIAQGPDAGGWDAFEATLLRLADQLYRNSSVTDATWRTLSASYDLVHLMDAVETVNHFTVLSMLYNSFGVQPDDQSRDRLPTDVSYRVAVPEREAPLAAARVVAPAGRGIAVGRTFALYPKLTERWGPRQAFVNRVSKLSSRHREMLILRMGWNCRSEYEWAQHVGRVGRAREHGLDPLWIAEGPGAAGWDVTERLILRAVDELFRDGMVADATWSALGDRFDTGLMMSAVLTASAYRAISLSLNTYGVQHEPEDERFPQLTTR